MQITEKTKYRDVKPFEPCFSEDTISAIKEQAERMYGGMYDLPFEVFWACSNGDFSILGDLSDPTVFQVYWLKQFEQFTKDFAAALKKYTLKPTSDEEKASANLIQTTWGESILVFVQQYFELKSFKEAEKITTGEILIAKRAQYNRDKFQREMAKIQMQKLNQK